MDTSMGTLAQECREKDTGKVTQGQEKRKVAWLIYEEVTRGAAPTVLALQGRGWTFEVWCEGRRAHKVAGYWHRRMWREGKLPGASMRT